MVSRKEFLADSCPQRCVGCARGVSPRQVEQLVCRAPTAQLPDFEGMTREQEANWWDEHDVADELWEEGPEFEVENPTG